jgi:excisionase family DNA binding protein
MQSYANSLTGMAPRVFTGHMSDAASESVLISLPEAAAVLGIHQTTAYRLAREGKFPVPVVKIGHMYRVNRILLNRYLVSGKPAS